jgi:hypothetical protein
MSYFTEEDLKLARNLPEIIYEKDNFNPGPDIYSKQFCMIKLKIDHEWEDIAWMSDQSANTVRI